jgi:DNA-binding response OmpR family regulator
VADCARHGLLMLERKFPDLALVDLRLPDFDGLELIRRVRGADGVASRINPDTPLLALSGRTGELDRLRGFERGVDDYLTKASVSVPSSASPTRLTTGRTSSS